MPENQEQNYQEQLESDRALDRRQIEEDEKLKKSRQDQQDKESGRMGVMLFAPLLILCVLADLLDMFTLGTIGWVVGFFVDAVLLLSFGLSSGGRKQFKRMVIGVVGDSIPGIAILPFRTFFLVWSFVKSRHELPIQLGLSGYKQTELGK